ncbi:MAG: hypothetical protein ACTHL3_01860 [Candidatus Nitrosocosmicus sp.]
MTAFDVDTIKLEIQRYDYEIVVISKTIYHREYTSKSKKTFDKRENVPIKYREAVLCIAKSSNCSHLIHNLFKKKE